ncbi:MAG: SNF2-related protein [Cyanobacteria bacterium J06635_11]
MRIESHPASRHHVLCRFGYDQKTKDAIKAIPGVLGMRAWEPDYEAWRVPQNCVSWLHQQYGAVIQAGVSPEVPWGQLREYQRSALARALQRDSKSFVFAFDTGLGKTLTVIKALEQLRCQRVLIVCPALVRRHWLDELAKWYPHHPHAAVIRYGRKRKLGKKATLERDVSYQAPIQVVSYALLGEVSNGPWDAFVFDEAHALAHPSSKQWQCAHQLRMLNKDAACFMLSATLAPTEVQQLYGPLSVLEPDCWGRLDTNGKRSFQFLKRYTNGERGQYGWKFEGINPVHADELRCRFDEVSARVTADDVKMELPQITFQTLAVEAGKTTRDELAAGAAEVAGFKKVQPAIEWVEQHQSSASHLCVFTWHRSVAQKLAESLDTVAITGEMDVQSRLDAVAQIAESPRGVVVATMASLGIGINLGFCKHLLFAQLYPRSERMLQALGRVSGLRAQAGTTVTFMTLENGADVRYAYLLAARLNAIDSVYETGAAAEALGGLVDDKKLLSDLAAYEFDFELDELDFDDE